MKQAEIFEVFIERIVPDGYGIGFAENLTFFVPLSAPGDKVRVRVNRKKGKIVFANIVQILEPSPQRVPPPCPYFGPCGGCDFQQINYEGQLAAKVGIIRDCLRRIAKIEWQDEIEIIPSAVQWNYRTRVQWKREGDKLGYFERNSHRIIDINVCPILTEPLEEELEGWRKRIKNKKQDFSEIQAVSSGDSISWRFSNNSKSSNKNFDENFYAANKESASENNVVFGASDNNVRDSSNASGKTAVLDLKIRKFVYKFSADTFFQVNHALLTQFVELVINQAEGNFALDLYSGVGLFALPLAEKFEEVIGVEGNQASVTLAQNNAAAAGFKNVRFETALVGEWLKQNAKNLSKIDFVLLDPPRTGAERETIENLLYIKPRQIVYVSCNPATLARDLRILRENYEIERIMALDFFPQTHHIETIVGLKIST